MQKKNIVYILELHSHTVEFSWKAHARTPPKSDESLKEPSPEFLRTSPKKGIP